LEGSSPPGGAGGSWTPPKAEPEAGASGAGLDEAATAGAVFGWAGSGCAGAAAVFGAFAFGLPGAGVDGAAGGQGAAAAEFAGGDFFLKIEPRLFAAFSTFFASVETLELLWLVEPFCAVAAPAAVLQAACDAFCAPLWLLCARALEENVRISSRVMAKENSAVRVDARRIIPSVKHFTEKSLEAT